MEGGGSVTSFLMPLSVSFLETHGSFLKTQSWGGVGVSHLLHFLRHKDHFLRHKSWGGGGGSVISFLMPLSVCLETQGSFLKTQELGWRGGQSSPS